MKERTTVMRYLLFLYTFIVGCAGVVEGPPGQQGDSGPQGERGVRGPGIQTRVKTTVRCLPDTIIDRPGDLQVYYRARLDEIAIGPGNHTVTAMGCGLTLEGPNICDDMWTDCSGPHPNERNPTSDCLMMRPHISEGSAMVTCGYYSFNEAGDVLRGELWEDVTFTWLEFPTF